MPRFASLFDPTRALDREQSSDLVPLVPQPCAQSLQRPNTPCKDGVITELIEHLDQAERVDRYLQAKSIDDFLGDFCFLRHAIAQGDLDVRAEDRHQNSWHSSPGSNVENFFLGPEQCR